MGKQSLTTKELSTPREQKTEQIGQLMDQLKQIRNQLTILKNADKKEEEEEEVKRPIIINQYNNEESNNLRKYIANEERHRSERRQENERKRIQLQNALNKAKLAKEEILNEKKSIESQLHYSLSENENLRKALGATTRALAHENENESQTPSSSSNRFRIHRSGSVDVFRH